MSSSISSKKVEYIMKIPPGYRRKCLDVGCGKALYREFFDEYVGLDLFTEEADVKADFHSYPFKSECFDVVILFDVIEHTTYYGVLLDEARRVLRPGGYLLLATTNNSGHAVETDPQHVHCFTVNLVLRVIERHGFTPLDIEEYCPERDNIICLAVRE